MFFPRVLHLLMIFLCLCACACVCVCLAFFLAVINGDRMGTALQTAEHRVGHHTRLNKTCTNAHLLSAFATTDCLLITFRPIGDDFV